MSNDQGSIKKATTLSADAGGGHGGKGKDLQVR